MKITVTRLQKKNREQLYPKMVARLIHEKYSADDEFALINNYIADPETYGAEYREYQDYREEVKTAVKNAFIMEENQES